MTPSYLNPFLHTLSMQDHFGSEHILKYSVFFFYSMPPTRRAAAAQNLLDDDAVIPVGSTPLPISVDQFDEGVGFRRCLLSGFQKGIFNARDVCTMSFHAMRGGCHGVADLALSPDQSGGNYYKHLEKALNLKTEACFYNARIPLWDVATQSRIRETFPMHLPHVIFSELFEKSPELYDPINYDFSELPPIWTQHPLFIAHGDSAIPVSLYSDGVPHSKTDSFYTYYFRLLNSRERHLICTVRRVDLCKCGCRGNCTFGAIGRIISWSFNQLASGQWPCTDHLGQPVEGRRGLLANGYVGALAEYRADLLEFTTALGFTQWNNILNPCFLCGAHRDDLFTFPSEMSSCSWAPRDAEAYRIMVERSTKKIRIPSRAVFDRLMNKCEWDPADIGGLGLAEDCPELGLSRGWRLMEDGPIVDLHDFSNLRFPTTLTFFDTRNYMGLSFVSPLLNGVIGFNISHLCLDLMHVVDLGISQHLVGTILRTLVVRNHCGSTLRRAAARQVANLVALRRIVAHREACTHSYGACAAKVANESKIQRLFRA